MQHNTPPLKLVVETPAGLLIRTVASAMPLVGDVDQGIAAETATGSAAALWGLPDFVFEGAIRKVGSGARELGDVLVLHGGRGVVVQVKSRTEPSGEPAREAAWIHKAVNKATRQAQGTVKQLIRAPADLMNLRGRPSRVDGAALEWLAVVVVDHPTPPDDVTPDVSSARLPTLVLIRRDWDFLFDQLRSTHAVIDYLNRVTAMDPVPLGHEPLRYYSLAQADEEAQPEPPSPQVLGESGRPVSLPLLPKVPAGRGGTESHVIVRMILEDVATAPIGEGTEADRMTVLAEIDALPVSYRAELGTHVLWMLDHVSDSPPGETKWAFRRFRSDRGLQHLMFGACSRYDRIIHQRFEEWVVLRHVEFANDLGTPEELTSVGILLTPRHDDVRPWDTTMIRASGEFDLTPQELAEMRMLWTDEPG